jgi:hypothetical protein
MSPRNPGQGRVMTSGKAGIMLVRARAALAEKVRIGAHPPQGDSADPTSMPSDRRGFLVSVALTVVALAVPPLFPSPAQDLVDRWTLEELDAWQEAQVLRVWREDPWRVITVLWDMGVTVPEQLVASAERRMGRLA